MMMQWMLVMLAFGSPVKTDLVFSTLTACNQMEESVRKRYAEEHNKTVSSAKASLPQNQWDGIEKMSMARMSSGICIPVARP